MSRIPDRHKMRRNYLRAIMRVYALHALALVVSLFLLVGCFYGCMFICDKVSSIIGESIIWSFIRWLVYAVGYFLTAIGVIAAWAVLMCVCSAKFVAESIPHVPRVGEQVNALPAEEVLLRGSQVSPTAPEDLLLPAGRQETKAEELLRATEGASQHNREAVL